MGLMDAIRRDVSDITSNANDFATEVLFAVTDGETVTQETINAVAVKHHVVYDPSTGATSVNGKQARVTVSELACNDAEYPVRDTNNHISLIGHTVTWEDINGTQATYTIKETHPNETTGLIVCILAEKGTVTAPGRLIIGWTYAALEILIVNEVDESEVIELPNGDTIPKQYVLNDDGTLTIPYLAENQLNVLAGFYFDNVSQNSCPYDSATGTFDGSGFGGFLVDNQIAFNAVIPIWQS
jgi:hypothetical protein